LKKKKKENQRLTLVLLLKADDSNVREVPEVMVPLLVIASGVLADREAKSDELPGKKKEEVLGKRTRDTERPSDIAAFDDLASNSKNLIGTQRQVERCGDGRTPPEHVQHGAVARLYCRDGSGISQDVRVSDEVRSAKIRAHASLLYDPCGRD
jgi:hypothetical protein